MLTGERIKHESSIVVPKNPGSGVMVEEQIISSCTRGYV